jgi:uncharacterized protein YidB (DUF937 family)
MRQARSFTMGLLDAMLGSVLGGGQQPTQTQGSGGGNELLMQIVAAMLANRGNGAAGQGGGLGGLAELAEQFQRGGLGDAMSSWIGTGPNQPVSPDQLGGVLGSDLIGEIVQRTGMGQGDVLGQLSQVLPQMVDRATPQGRVPEGGLGDIGSILAQLDRGTGRG